MKKYLLMLLISLFLIICLVLFVKGDLNCAILIGNSCPAGTGYRLIGLQNDSAGGYSNAHAQNTSFATYAYSVCCNNTNTSVNITAACPGNTTVIKLSNGTNAHIEIGTNSNYAFDACLGSNVSVVNCSYVAGTCPAGSSCILSMVNSEGINTTNAHVGNCSTYYQKVCCSINNSAPTKPNITYPAYNNITVFERQVNFSWTTSTDPEGGNVNYTINASCSAAGCSASCVSISVNVTSTNYTAAVPLCVDYPYNFTVTACDQFWACNSSNWSNFTVQSQANIILVINQTSFGTMNINSNNDTTDNSPTPLVIRNIGNVVVNSYINASGLFTSVGMGLRNYQFAADLNGTTSFNTSCSQYYTTSGFANMTTTPQNIFCNLSYNNASTANNQGQIEINITVPGSEPANPINSTLYLNASTTYCPNGYGC